MIRHTIQFGGLSQEGLNVHISNFSESNDTFKHNGVIDDTNCSRLLPFSLSDKAKKCE